MLRTLALLLILPVSAQALDFGMPVGLKQIAQEESALATIELPVQVWDGTSVPSVQLQVPSPIPLFNLMSQPSPILWRRHCYSS